MAERAMPMTVTAKPMETKTEAARCCFCRNATWEMKRGGSLMEACKLVDVVVAAAAAMVGAAKPTAD